MQSQHFIDAMQASIQTASAIGSFVALLVTKKYQWAHVVVYFLIGQATAFYFTAAIVDGLGWDPKNYSWVGFTIGVVGMLFWGGAIKLFENLRDDPKGTIDWARKLWKGQE